MEIKGQPILMSLKCWTESHQESQNQNYAQWKWIRQQPEGWAIHGRQLIESSFNSWGNTGLQIWEAMSIEKRGTTRPHWHVQKNNNSCCLLNPYSRPGPMPTADRHYRISNPHKVTIIISVLKCEIWRLRSSPEATQLGAEKADLRLKPDLGACMSHYKVWLQRW